MKSKIVRGIINGGVLAAVAALGITVYQLGTKPITEDSRQEDSVQMEETDPEGEISDEDASDAAISGRSIENENGNASENQNGENNGTTVNKTDDTEKEKNMSASEDSADKAASADAITGNTDSNGLEAGEAQNTAENGVSAYTAETSAAGIAAQNLNFTEDSIMEWPVRGTVLVDYNMNETVYFPTLDQYRVSPAIALQAVEDAPVYAAADGQVLSVEQDACTGTTVTVELGNGYQAVYGQLKDLTVAEGDTIKEGEVIGNIGEPTKYYSVEGPNLYFAMKKDGEPVDPFEYLE